MLASAERTLATWMLVGGGPVETVSATALPGCTLVPASGSG